MAKKKTVKKEELETKKQSNKKTVKKDTKSKKTADFFKPAAYILFRK